VNTFDSGLLLRIRVAVGVLGILLFVIMLLGLLATLFSPRDEYWTKTLIGAPIFIVVGFLMARWGCKFKTKAQVEIENNLE
jgi:hypothetical protein